MNEKITMTKRFYLGSKSISESNGKSSNLGTLDEALDHACSAVESGDRIRYVVEIVRIVKRTSNPIIIHPIIIQGTR